MLNKTKKQESGIGNATGLRLNVALLSTQLAFVYLDLLTEFFSDKTELNETEILFCCEIALFLFSYK